MIMTVLNRDPGYTGPRTIDASMAGTWLDGSQGWHNAYRVVDRAVQWGALLTPYDRACCDLYAANDDDGSAVSPDDPTEVITYNDAWEAVSGQNGLQEAATEYLSRMAPRGFDFIRDMGELYLGPICAHLQCEHGACHKGDCDDDQSKHPDWHCGDCHMCIVHERAHGYALPVCGIEFSPDPSAQQPCMTCVDCLSTLAAMEDHARAMAALKCPNGYTPETCDDLCGDHNESTCPYCQHDESADPRTLADWQARHDLLHF